MAEKSLRGFAMKAFGAAVCGAAGVAAGFYGALHAASFLAASTGIGVAASALLPIAGLLIAGYLIAKHSPNIYTKSFGLGLMGGAGYFGFEVSSGITTEGGSFARQVLGK